MPRGRVVRDVPMVLGVADGRWRGRLDDVDNGSRQSAQAHHAAALRPGRLVVIVRGGRRFVSNQCRTVGIVRFAEKAVPAGMFVNMTIPMNVLRSAVARLMNVNNAELVARIREARRLTGSVAQCKRKARRQYAKQIDQGDQPPCPQSLRSGQTHEHLVFHLAI